MSSKSKRRRQRRNKLKATKKSLYLNGSSNIDFDVADIYLINKEQEFNVYIPNGIKLTIKNYIKYIIYAAGKNEHGQIGLGYKNKDFALRNKNDRKYEWKRLFELESLINSFNNIYRNHTITMIKTINNELYSSGIMNMNKKSKNPFKWTKVSYIQTPKIMSRGIANRMHVFIENNNDNLFVSGFDYNHQFADNGAHFMRDVCLLNVTPSLNKWLPSNEEIIDIQCGYVTSFFLTSTHRVYACGGLHRMFDVDVIQENGDNDDIFTVDFTPKLVAKNIDMIAIGSSHCAIFLDKNKKIKVFGINTNMDKLKNINIIKVVSGHWHCIVLTDNYEIYSFGINDKGQIGNGTKDTICDEYGEFEDIDEPFHIKLNEDIVDIECGGFHSLLLSINNNLYTFGDNLYNQCSSIKRSHEIIKPYLFNKKREIEKHYVIQKMFGLRHETILVLSN